MCLNWQAGVINERIPASYSSLCSHSQASIHGRASLVCQRAVAMTSDSLKKKTKTSSQLQVTVYECMLGSVYITKTKKRLRSTYLSPVCEIRFSLTPSQTLLTLIKQPALKSKADDSTSSEEADQISCADVFFWDYTWSSLEIVSPVIVWDNTQGSASGTDMAAPHEPWRKCIFSMLLETHWSKPRRT